MGSPETSPESQATIFNSIGSEDWKEAANKTLKGEVIPEETDASPAVSSTAVSGDASPKIARSITTEHSTTLFPGDIRLREVLRSDILAASKRALEKLRNSK